METRAPAGNQLCLYARFSPLLSLPSLPRPPPPARKCHQRPSCPPCLVNGAGFCLVNVVRGCFCPESEAPEDGPIFLYGIRVKPLRGWHQIRAGSVPSCTLKRECAHPYTTLLAVSHANAAWSWSFLGGSGQPNSKWLDFGTSSYEGDATEAYGAYLRISLAFKFRPSFPYTRARSLFPSPARDCMGASGRVKGERTPELGGSHFPIWLGRRPAFFLKKLLTHELSCKSYGVGLSRDLVSLLLGPLLLLPSAAD